jgi:hypothetical protein
MPFEPHRAIGFAPSMEEIMEDLGVDSPADFREAILLKCKQLYKVAQDTGNIESFGTEQEFIVCDSSDFYQTLVNMGYGNSALVISDDYGPDVYFLMFDDKVPVQFRPVVAAHESAEYHLVKNEGLEQRLAHKKASRNEIVTADRLCIKETYLEYLKTYYPTKLDELKEWNII